MFFEGYPCSCDKLCLRLGVATCVSFDATGLVAVKAQQHWHCRRFTACSGAPGPGLSSSAISLTAHFVCLHLRRAYLHSCSTAYRGGRSYSEMYFPASSRSSCCIELVCFLHMAGGTACPHAAAPAQFIILKDVVLLTSTPSVFVG